MRARHWQSTALRISLQCHLTMNRLERKIGNSIPFNPHLTQFLYSAANLFYKETEMFLVLKASGLSHIVPSHHWRAKASHVTMSGHGCIQINLYLNAGQGPDLAHSYSFCKALIQQISRYEYESNFQKGNLYSFIFWCDITQHPIAFFFLNLYFGNKVTQPFSGYERSMHLRCDTEQLL